MPKAAPSFWWDFAQPTKSPIIVQSDYPGGECLAEFPFSNEHEAFKAIDKALALIDDFKAGRQTPYWRKRNEH